MKITTGRSRKDTHWKVKEVEWGKLVAKLMKPVTTPETMSEYKAMSKDDKAEVKDIGGFVGGVIEGGRRTRSAVKSRSLVTLDADFAEQNAWETASCLCDFMMCYYSTHSHTPKAPRLRFVIPLDREVTPEEYEPIARRVASWIGIDQFDITTYEPSRLMYWPSVASDAEFKCGCSDEDTPFLCADDVLATYHDWRDTTEWPLGSSEQTVRVKQAKAQGDPTEKPGLIGAFCRVYDVPSAIETFLPDIYLASDDPNRYTYTAGSTTGGLVLYQNGSFAYSHHSTDPACGVLCNAFDLVRLHKFGELDYGVDRDTPINKLPSYQAMCDFASEDPEVKKGILQERQEAAAAAFAEAPDEPDADAWMQELEFNKKGQLLPSIENFRIILDKDPRLVGCFGTNTFRGTLCLRKDAPWRPCFDAVNGDMWTDSDSSELIRYIDVNYGLYSKDRFNIALDVAFAQHSFHPVRDYLNTLTWDGTKRAEMLFVNYFGAPNDVYTKTVTRKWLAAAVARVFTPGVKFDNLVVLVGAQGIGKSYLGHKLGRGWFSDTFGTVQGKEAYEQLKGNWIIEIAELSAMRRAEVEAVKMFISKQEDTFRGAYKRYAEVNKRQCVFYGTTNDDQFLSDTTGNRRFWPIRADMASAPLSVFDLTEYEVDQIWAEAVVWVKKGESLYLSQELTKIAAEEQADYLPRDPRIDQIAEYLDKPIPDNWDELSKADRRNYIQGFLSADGPTHLRDVVSTPEIAYELFGQDVIQLWQAREYAKLLKQIPGWKRTRGHKRTIYGRPEQYVRTEAEDADS